MAPARDSLVSDRPPGWPAWLVSLAIHASMLIALLIWLRHPSVRGAVDEPSRDVGIVLKHRTDDGPKFESPEFMPDNDQDDDQDNDNDVSNNHRPPSDQPSLSATQPGDPTLAALPSVAEIPSSQAALPQLPTLGPGALTHSQVGDVGQMTSGGATSKSVGRKATVSVFGISGTGTRFVYVFDRSISMTGAPLRAAKRQLIDSLAALDSVHQFQIIFFNHEPQAWDLTGGQGRIAFATDANKHLAKQFVQNTTATGGTFRRTALQLALRLRPDVIFFLTDTDDPMATRDLAEAIERAQQDAIAINTIEYGSGVASTGESFLVQLARETGGRYVYVDTQALAR